MKTKLPARGHPGANTTLAGPTFSTITCYGGGAGGTENQASRWNQTPGGNGINPGNSNNKIGDTGGSGGGTNNGGPNGGLGGGLSYGSGQSMQGTAGGSNSTSYTGSGGGGMGGAGGNSGIADGGPGGNGAGFAGVPPAYGTPGPNGSYRYFAGGGGGGGNSNGNGGSDSYGGGGRGSNQPGSTNMALLLELQILAVAAVVDPMVVLHPILGGNLVDLVSLSLGHSSNKYIYKGIR